MVINEVDTAVLVVINEVDTSVLVVINVVDTSGLILMNVVDTWGSHLKSWGRHQQKRKHHAPSASQGEPTDHTYSIHQLMK